VLLAIDIGNTNVVLGLFDGPDLLHHWRIGTRRGETSDECAVLVASLFRLAELELGCVSDAVIGCVVPPLLPIFERMCEKSFGCTPLVVGPGTRSGIPIRVDNPPEVGADRIVNAVAAHNLLGAPVIAIDFGTAVTFDCVSRGGEFVGGMIFPGVLVALEGLVQRAARLSSVEIIKPPQTVGRNTIHMLQSGMLYGYAGLVDSCVERIRSELGSEARVLATGGLAHLVAAESRTIERIEPFLTLQGLRLVYECNRESRSARRSPEPARRRPARIPNRKEVE
jgi:type III pantothenate kinase